MCRQDALGWTSGGEGEATAAAITVTVTVKPPNEFVFARTSSVPTVSEVAATISPDTD